MREGARSDKGAHREPSLLFCVEEWSEDQEQLLLWDI